MKRFEVSTIISVLFLIASEVSKEKYIALITAIIAAIWMTKAVVESFWVE